MLMRNGSYSPPGPRSLTTCLSSANATSGSYWPSTRPTTTDDDPIAAASSAHPVQTTRSPTFPRSGSSAGPSSAASSTNTSGPRRSPGQGGWPSSGTPHGPGGEHEPFRMGIRARASGRDLHSFDTGGGEDRVEGCGKLSGSVADQEPEVCGAVARVHQEVADRLRACPGAGKAADRCPAGLLGYRRGGNAEPAVRLSRGRSVRRACRRHPAGRLVARRRGRARDRRLGGIRGAASLGREVLRVRLPAGGVLLSIHL